MKPAPDHADGTPFADLSFDLILTALERLGYRPDGRLFALNSYENRVFQIGMEEGPALIAKFYRPQRWSDAAILEEHALVADLAAAEIPVVAALRVDGQTLHHQGHYRFALFERRGGRAPELDRLGVLAWLGRFLGRIHALGALGVYRERGSIDLHTFGEEPRAWLLDHDFIAPELKASYAQVSAQALEAAATRFARCEPRLIRLHGDCHIGNVLWTDDGPHFVDFDDSRMAAAVQDLWMLLSGSRDEQEQQLAQLLRGYREFADFDSAELQLIEAYRTLRLIHYSAWLAKRWQDPAFPVAFPWFTSQRYWQERITELREQIEAMDEPPLVPGAL